MKNYYFNKLRKTCLLTSAALCIFVALGPQVAVATVIKYDLINGQMRPRIYTPTKSASDYRFAPTFSVETLDLFVDEAKGRARLKGSMSGDLFNQKGNKVGTSTASLNILYKDLSVSPDLGDSNNPIYLLGVKGRSISSGALQLDLDFQNGRHESERINVFGGFANVKKNHSQFGDITGTPFNFILRENGAIDLWVKSVDGKPFTLFNQPFALHGDIHATTSVPEPSTILLLGSAVVGLARKKKPIVIHT